MDKGVMIRFYSRPEVGDEWLGRFDRIFVGRLTIFVQYTTGQVSCLAVRTMDNKWRVRLSDSHDESFDSFELMSA